MAAVSVACLITSTTQSFALSIGGCLGRVCESGGTVVAQGTNCSSSSRTCYDDQAVISCSACNSGYTRTAKTVTVDMCDDPVTYYTCTSGGSVGQACGRKSCGVGANIVRRGLNCLSYASERVWIRHQATKGCKVVPRAKVDMKHKHQRSVLLGVQTH